MTDAFQTSGNSPTTLEPAYTIEDIHKNVAKLQMQLGFEPSSFDDCREDFTNLLQECDYCKSYEDKNRTYGYVHYLAEDFIDFHIYCNVCIVNFTLEGANVDE